LLVLNGQVHHDTHVIPMGNYVIVVGNYVIATPSEPGNYMSADTYPAEGGESGDVGYALRKADWEQQDQAVGHNPIGQS
jgi:hypothetical protein